MLLPRGILYIFNLWDGPVQSLALLYMTVLSAAPSQPILGMLAPSPVVNCKWSSQGVHVEVCWWGKGEEVVGGCACGCEWRRSEEG